MTEHDECVALHDWLTLKKIKHAHIPNETFTTSWSQKARNRQVGVSKGFPDYCVVVGDRVLFIEMKKAPGKRGGNSGSTTSAEQIEWLQALDRCVGVSACVCRGFEEARRVIESIERA
jgi:hypothetical protein